MAEEQTKPVDALEQSSMEQDEDESSKQENPMDGPISQVTRY